MDDTLESNLARPTEIVKVLFTALFSLAPMLVIGAATYASLSDVERQQALPWGGADARPSSDDARPLIPGVPGTGAPTPSSSAARENKGAGAGNATSTEPLPYLDVKVTGAWPLGPAIVVVGDGKSASLRSDPSVRAKEVCGIQHGRRVNITGTMKKTTDYYFQPVFADCPSGPASGWMAIDVLRPPLP